MSREGIACSGDWDLRVPRETHGRALLVLAEHGLPHLGIGSSNPSDEITTKTELEQALLAIPQVEQAYLVVQFRPPHGLNRPMIRIMVKQKPQSQISTSQIRAIRFLAETYSPMSNGESKLDFKLVNTNMDDLLESAKTPAQRRREQKELEAELNKVVRVEVEMEYSQRPTIARYVYSPK